MNERVNELHARHGYLLDLAQKARAAAAEVATPDTGAAAAALVGVLHGDLPQSAGEKALTKIASEAHSAASMHAKSAAWIAAAEQIEADASDVAREIDRAHEAARAERKAARQATAAGIIEKYLSAFEIAADHLAELHVLADELAPLCAYSQGNVLNNEAARRPNWIDVPSVGNREGSILAIDATRVTAARVRLSLD